MTKAINARLLALEAATQPGGPYSPLMPGCKRLPVLVQQGPNQEAELAAAIKQWGAAELDAPENCAKWMG